MWKTCGKAAAVLAVLIMFAQWYLPKRGWPLAVPANSPNFMNLSQMLLEERYTLRYRLLDNRDEVTRGVIWDNGMRASRAQQKTANKHSVLLVGCSWTFGVGVNDEQTYPWLLGELFPECDFDNAAVPGYGPYVSLLSMQDYLSQRQYDAVMYAAIPHHLCRECRYFAEKVHSRKETEDFMYVRSYCGLGAPEAGSTRPRLLPRPGYCAVWPGDDRLYIINFLKHLTLRLGNVWVPRLTEHGRYGRFMHDEELSCERYSLLLEAMNSTAHRHGARFVFVDLNNVSSILKKFDRLPKSVASEKDQWDSSEFAVCDAHYPIDFLKHRELCTHPSSFDEGDHPGPKIHEYYAVKIADWLAHSPVSSSWIGNRSFKHRKGVASVNKQL